MGFSTRDMELLIRLKKDGYFTGGLSVVEIGAQQLSNTILKAPELVDYNTKENIAERLAKKIGAGATEAAGTWLTHSTAGALH